MEGWCGIIAFVVAWFIAQMAKFVIGLIEGKRLGGKLSLGAAIDYFMRSGGMPSGHTASFTALTVFLGEMYGWGSGIFALSVCTLIIIIYDATHVRYAVGVQGKALNTLLEKNNEPTVKIVEGHTPLQVAVGAVIGVVVGILASLVYHKLFLE